MRLLSMETGITVAAIPAIAALYGLAEAGVVPGWAILVPALVVLGCHFVFLSLALLTIAIQWGGLRTLPRLPRRDS